MPGGDVERAPWQSWGLGWTHVDHQGSRRAGAGNQYSSLSPPCPQVSCQCLLQSESSQKPEGKRCLQVGHSPRSPRGVRTRLATGPVGSGVFWGESEGGPGRGMFGRGWLFQADGEVWEELDLGGALNVLFGSLPACTPRAGAGADPGVGGGLGASAGLSHGSHFPVGPGGLRIAASGWGGLTLTLQPPPSSALASGPGLGVRQFHLFLGLRLAQPATALSPAVRAARM